MNIELTDEQSELIRRLAADAKCIDDDDWGSERQIAADNKFWFHLADLGIVIDDAETAHMSCDECVDYALIKLGLIGR